MPSEKISIHTMKIANGIEIQYARIFRKHECSTVGQSVLLSRLNQEQLRRVTTASELNYEPS